MQADKKQAANKLAMSRALGAAFLSHQVEQLEKTVGRESRGATSNNWRERSGQAGRGGRSGGPHTPAQHPHGGRKRDRKDGERGEAKEKEAGRVRESVELGDMKEPEKDADTVVVDASVLVHALGQVKKWCKDGRQEEIVIPLEALNTLDLLKKGATPLAQRARAASRILEAQVGTNPRIRVQRDDAFVLWDNVNFSTPSPVSGDPLSLPPRSGNIPTGLAPPPEWLRRTICCSSWEVSNAAAGFKSGEHSALASPQLFKPSISPVSRSSTPVSSAETPPNLALQPQASPDEEIATSEPHPPKRVVLAVLAQPVPVQAGTTTTSLDANTFHPGRHERADGSLVRVWAQRAGIEVFDVDPSIAPPASPSTPHHGHPNADKRRLHAHGGSDRRELREGKDGLPDRDHERKPSLVEKPIAMSIVNDQPVKVLRVLARGEKLDP